ncbi:hypothetical protein LX32DRAFT_106713 [Colletotrichum zoysiae]|uniref:Uncharacterized protein n=1 Tax=Colletotrichum zoysiae TaxID=1216348 RepID=A0AAD9M3S7_9PEZI|nr:hypothetical protein LX32DRAFT_106713 [Colletotrichum zoysiae]
MGTGKGAFGGADCEMKCRDLPTHTHTLSLYLSLLLFLLLFVFLLFFGSECPCPRCSRSHGSSAPSLVPFPALACVRSCKLAHQQQQQPLHTKITGKKKTIIILL